jgi:hypothetical protein
MKLVATSDFRNNNPDRIKLDDAQHDLHVHKGARLSIGDELPFEKLPAADKKLVVELNAAGRIVAEDQTEKVKQIDAEVKAEKAAEEARNKKPEAAKK